MNYLVIEPELLEYQRFQSFNQSIEMCQGHKVSPEALIQQSPGGVGGEEKTKECIAIRHPFTSFPDPVYSVGILRKEATQKEVWWKFPKYRVSVWIKTVKTGFYI